MPLNNGTERTIFSLYTNIYIFVVFHGCYQLFVLDFYSNLKCSFLFKQQTLQFNLKISLFGFLIKYIFKRKIKIKSQVCIISYNTRVYNTIYVNPCVYTWCCTSVHNIFKIQTATATLNKIRLHFFLPSTCFWLQYSFFIVS